MTTDNPYWRACDNGKCKHMTLREIKTTGRFAIIKPERCPVCRTKFKGY